MLTHGKFQTPWTAYCGSALMKHKTEKGRYALIAPVVIGEGREPISSDEAKNQLWARVREVWDEVQHGGKYGDYEETAMVMSSFVAG